MRYSKLELIKKLIVFVSPLIFIMCITIILRVLGFIVATAIPVLGVIGSLSIIEPTIIESIISFKTIIILLISCAISRGILHYFEQLSGHYIAFTLLAMIRDKVFATMRRLAFEKLQKKESGSLLTVITSDIEMLEVFYAHTIAPVASAIIYFVFMFIVLFHFHFVISICMSLIYLILGIALPVLFSKMENNIGSSYRKKLAELNSFFLDSIMGIKEIVFFNTVYKRQKEINKKGDAIKNNFKRFKKFEGNTTSVTEAVLTICNIFMIAICALLVLTEHINFVRFLITASILISGYGPILAVTALAVNLQQTFVAAERVFSLLDEEEKIKEVTSGENIKFDNIKAEHINFKYENADVLNDINLQLHKNQIIGLCGKSGSGKSTFLKLLMRFYDPISGCILMNSVDIKNVNNKSLRNCISYMTQQTYIFKKTIYENILLARRDATKEDVIDSAKKASIHNFIISLPNGYDTKISELGQNLSSGEKQRIGLARAFLHNAPLLLLDEPTGNLDSLNEAVILNSIFSEKDEKAILIVSHRKSTVNIADKIYTMNSGRLH